MKEGILFGMVVGLIAGAILVETCKPAQDIVNQGKSAVKKAMTSMQKSQS